MKESNGYSYQGETPKYEKDYTKNLNKYISPAKEYPHYDKEKNEYLSLNESSNLKAPIITTKKSSNLKKNKPNAQKVMSLLGVTAGATVTTIAVVTVMIYVSIVSFLAGIDFLKFDLSITAPEETEFYATLTETTNENNKFNLSIDKDNPTILFSGLKPETEYLLEVFSNDGEKHLSLSYVTLKDNTSPTPTKTTEPTPTEVDPTEVEPTEPIDPPVENISIEELALSPMFDSVYLDFKIENGTLEDIKAFFNGIEIEIEESEFGYLIFKDNLLENTTYLIEIKDSKDNIVYSKEFTTLTRNTATATLNDITVGVKLAKIDLNIVNTDQNIIKAYLGDTEIEYVFNNDILSINLSELDPNTSYSYKIVDETKNQVIFENTFATASVFTYTQNDEEYDLLIQLTNEFVSEFGNIKPSILDEFNASLELSTLRENKYLANGKLIYSGNYNVIFKDSNNTIYEETITIDGHDRPVFQMKYHKFTPASIPDSYSEFATYPNITYTLKSGYFPEEEYNPTTYSPMYVYGLAVYNNENKMVLFSSEYNSDYPLTRNWDGQESDIDIFRDITLPAGAYTAYLMKLDYDSELFEPDDIEDYEEYLENISDAFDEDGIIISSSTFNVTGETYPTTYLWWAEVNRNYAEVQATLSITVNIDWYSSSRGYKVYVIVVNPYDISEKYCDAIRIDDDDTEITIENLPNMNEYLIIQYIDKFQASNYLSTYKVN